MFFFTTEVTSSKIASDKPLYARTKKAYELIKGQVRGEVLEIGCGEGYGIPLYYDNVDELTLIDKSRYTIAILKNKYPEARLIQSKVPPLSDIEDNYFDNIILFQVIEHIKNDHLLISELYRVLKPGGKAFLTTPNASKTLARNPWHFKEYTFEDLKHLITKNFKIFEIKGIEGNNKTDSYYNLNRTSVSQLLKLDVFKLQHRIPSFLLILPYELLNRINRKKLLRKKPELIDSITCEDYQLKDFSEGTLDFFCVLCK